jgi:hypothetical protein
MESLVPFRHPVLNARGKQLAASRLSSLSRETRRLADQSVKAKQKNHHRSRWTIPVDPIVFQLILRTNLHSTKVTVASVDVPVKGTGEENLVKRPLRRSNRRFYPISEYNTTSKSKDKGAAQRANIPCLYPVVSVYLNRKGEKGEMRAKGDDKGRSVAESPGNPGYESVLPLKHLHCSCSSCRLDAYSPVQDIQLYML